MTNKELVAVRDLLGFTNQSLGKELGYAFTKHQCKQIDNLVNGDSKIKPVVVLALECLARRKGKYKEFLAIQKKFG
ncbi:MAG: hypothetical protein CMK64_05020 [Pseudoalteromonas sp.]|nr:hypothetical protein [Pseudoalteromonas sp.]